MFWLLFFSPEFEGPKEMERYAVWVFLATRYSIIPEGSQEQQTLMTTTLNLTNLSWKSLLSASFYNSQIQPSSRITLSDEGRTPSIKVDFSDIFQKQKAIQSK